MKPCDDAQVLLLQAEWILDRLPSEDVPSLCMELLSAGFDTPTLRILAGLPPVEIGEVRELLPRLFREFDLRQPTGIQAAWRSYSACPCETKTTS